MKNINHLGSIGLDEVKLAIIKNNEKEMGSIKFDKKNKRFKVYNPYLNMRENENFDVPQIIMEVIDQNRKVLVSGSSNKFNLNSIYNAINGKSFANKDKLRFRIIKNDVEKFSIKVFDIKKEKTYIFDEGILCFEILNNNLNICESKNLNVENCFADNYLAKEGYVINGNIADVFFEKDSKKYFILKNKQDKIIYKSQAKNVNWYSIDKKNYSGYQVIIRPDEFIVLSNNLEISFYIEYKVNGKKIEDIIHLNSTFRNTKTLEIV